MSKGNSNGQAFASIEFTIEGLTPHVQHNGQLADVTNQYAVQIKELTSKKKKTEADYKQIETLEWEGSLYLDAQRRPIVPGTVIEGAYFGAGKKTREGQDVRNGIVSNGDWPLIYPGPKTLDGLRDDPDFRYRCIVVNPSTKGRTARTRPIFREWKLIYVVTYRTSLFNHDGIIVMTELLGSDVGLSDNRTKMGGRFRIIKYREL